MDCCKIDGKSRNRGIVARTELRAAGTTTVRSARRKHVELSQFCRAQYNCQNQNHLLGPHSLHRFWRIAPKNLNVLQQDKSTRGTSGLVAVLRLRKANLIVGHRAERPPLLWTAVRR